MAFTFLRFVADCRFRPRLDTIESARVIRYKTEQEDLSLLGGHELGQVANFLSVLFSDDTSFVEQVASLLNYYNTFVK